MNSLVKSRGYKFDPNGAWSPNTIPGRRVAESTQILLFIAYDANTPEKSLTTSERNKRIVALYRAGESISDLAREYGISPQRVHQIVNEAQL